MSTRFYTLLFILFVLSKVNITAQQNAFFYIDTLKYEKHEGTWYYNDGRRLWHVIENQIVVKGKENVNTPVIDFGEYGLPGLKIRYDWRSSPYGLLEMPVGTDFVDFALKLLNTGLFERIDANTAGEFAGSVDEKSVNALPSKDEKKSKCIQNEKSLLYK